MVVGYFEQVEKAAEKGLGLFCQALAPNGVVLECCKC
jgi:hypothetical protein